MNINERVHEIFADSLYKNDERVIGITPADAIEVNGIVRSFEFHPGRLNSHKAEITEIIAELDPTFHRAGGGGWSFLQLPFDKHGVQWGEQPDAELLLMLALGTGQAGYNLPRAMWDAFPGGVPYVWLG